jgi:hypothetical protein
MGGSILKLLSSPKVDLAKTDEQISEALAALDRRLRELGARAGVVLKSIIALEKAGAVRGDVRAGTAKMLDMEAQALLDGKAFVASREKQVSDLDALWEEQARIERAMTKGINQRYWLATKHAEDVSARYFGEVAEIERRRVMLALELQRTNRAREALREKIFAAGGERSLPTDEAELLGTGDNLHLGVHEVVEVLIDRSICTRREIENARGD